MAWSKFSRKRPFSSRIERRHSSKRLPGRGARGTGFEGRHKIFGGHPRLKLHEHQLMRLVPLIADSNGMSASCDGLRGDKSKVDQSDLRIHCGPLDVSIRGRCDHNVLLHAAHDMGGHLLIRNFADQ